MLNLSTHKMDGVITSRLIRRWVTESDQAMAAQRRHPRVKEHFLVGRALIHAVLATTTGREQWQIVPGTNGKPKAVTESGELGPAISIAHSEGLVLAAVSEGSKVGVDVEYWRPRDLAALSAYAFGPYECAAVKTQGIAVFYQIWTLREAIAKAMGTGLLPTLDGSDRVMPLSGTSAYISGAWRLWHHVPYPNYSLAIATPGEEIWDETSITWIDSTASL